MEARGEGKLSHRYHVFLQRLLLQTWRETKKKDQPLLYRAKAAAENQSLLWLHCNLTKQSGDDRMQNYNNFLAAFCLCEVFARGRPTSESFTRLQRNTGSSAGPRLLLLAQTDRRRMNSRLLTSTNTPTDPAALCSARRLPSEVVLEMQPQPQPRGY